MRLRSLEAAFQSNSGDISRKFPSFFVFLVITAVSLKIFLEAEKK